MDSVENAVVPEWLLETKEKISESQEWLDLSAELFTAIQEQLREYNVLFYTDLNDEEKAVVMDKASVAVQTGDKYKALNRRVSSVLDKQLNLHSIVKSENEMKTKTEKLLNCAAEGSAALLRRWPDQKSRTRVCFNREFPAVLRFEVWRLYLGCCRYATKYLETVKRNRIETVSVRDLEIGQKCEAILRSSDGQRFGKLSENLSFVFAMKCVLSWYHLQKGGLDLSESDYMLAIPIVSVVMHMLGHHGDNSVNENVVSLIIEMYFSLLEKRPKAILELSNEDNKAAANVMAQRVEVLLSSIDSQLCSSLYSALAVSSATQSGKDSNQEQVPLYKRLRNLLYPVVRRLFVGYVSLDVVCYMWDQLVVVIDNPLEDFLPYLCTTLLLLLKDSLQQCQSRHAVEHVLLTHSSKLTVRQFQSLIDQYFIQELQQLLQLQFSPSTAPVVDPLAAIGMPLPWEHWFRATDINSDSLVHDRHIQRQQRGEEYQRLMEAKREQEESRRRHQLEKERSLEEEKAQVEREMKQKENEQRMLEDQLEQEKTLRQRAESEQQQQQRELERLRQELAALTTTRRPSQSSEQQPGSESVQSHHTAEASENVQGTEDLLPAVTQGSPPLDTHLTTDQINTVMTDTLQRVMSAINTFTHGPVANEHNDAV